MATVPAKSQQPLHNFSLPFLKWGQRSHVNTSNRCRRLLPDATTTNNNTTPRRSLPTDSSDSSASASASDHDDNKQNSHKTHRSRSRTSKDREIKDDVETSKVGDVDVGAAAAAAGPEGEEPGTKPWNLRPRRSAASLAAISMVGNHTIGNGNGTGPGSSKSGRLLRGSATAEENEEDDKKKRKLWISLSKEEIEEDVYALTGSKPARRPKRRSKAVQKQIDNLFPGLYLVGMSADSYRV